MHKHLLALVNVLHSALTDGQLKTAAKAWMYLCVFDVVMYRYGTYQMIQKAAGENQHVAFTRILHRSEPDILMTQVAYPSHAQSACIKVVCQHEQS